MAKSSHKKPSKVSKAVKSKVSKASKSKVSKASKKSVKKSKRAPRNACNKRVLKSDCQAASRCKWTNSKKTKCRRASPWLAKLRKTMKSVKCTLKSAMIRNKSKGSKKSKASKKAKKSSK